MRMRSKLLQHLRRLAGDCRGVALVEFAILLPMLLLVFAVIIEGSRMFWTYQATIEGVRDATRYLARVVSYDICTAGGGVASYADTVRTIVEESTAGDSVFGGGITVDSVTPSLACVSGGYRVDPAGVASVSAQITIQFPFSGIFTLIGGSLSDITTTVNDSSRVFGT